MSRQVTLRPFTEPLKLEYLARRQELIKTLQEMSLEQLRKQLEDSHALARAIAVEMLGDRKDVRAITGLINLLQDPEMYVRGKAAQALGKIGDGRAITPLIDAVREDNDIHLIAARELCRIEDTGKVVRRLIDTLLQETERAARERVAEALGSIGEIQAITLLKDVLQDADSVRRIRAIEALGILKNRWVVESLLAALQDPDEGVRIATQEALKRIQDFYLEPMLNALQDQAWTMRKEAAEILGQLRETYAVEPLTEILLKEDEDPRVRKAAAEALGKIGDKRALGALLHTLSPIPPSNGSPTTFSDQVREAIEPVLLQMSQKQWRSLLATLQNTDEDVQVREQAAGLLGLLPNRNVVEALIAVLQDTRDYMPVRIAVAKALKQLKDPNTSPVLQALLQNPNEATVLRKEVAATLGEIGTMQALKTLAEVAQQDPEGELREAALCALHDPDSTICKAAVEVLGHYGSSQAVEPLIKALDAQNPAVSKAAAKALSQIDDKRAVKALRRYNRKKEGYKKQVLAWLQREQGHLPGWKASYRMLALVLLIAILVTGVILIHSTPESVHLVGNYPYSNTPVLDDPLKDNNLGHGWPVRSSTDAEYRFKDGAYYVAVSRKDSGLICAAFPLFKNFTYEVQMTLLEGEQGGIVFRRIHSSTLSLYGAFFIDAKGNYLVLARYPDAKGSLHLLLDGTDSAIKQGYNQVNLLSVTAYGNLFQFAVNGHKVGMVHEQMEGSNGWGNIGVAVNEHSLTTRAMFRNARVWELPDTPPGDFP